MAVADFPEPVGTKRNLRYDWDHHFIDVDHTQDGMAFPGKQVQRPSFPCVFTHSVLPSLMYSTVPSRAVRNT